MPDNTQAFAVTLINDTHPVLRQNENGPCFVIALVNAILLSDVQAEYSASDLPFRTQLIELATAKPPERVPIESVYSFLVDKLLQDPTDKDADHSTTNQLVNILPLLDSGLLINLSFDDINVSDFNDYSISITDLLNQFDLNIYHAFLMPSDLLNDLKLENVRPTFDQCQDFLVKHIDDETEDSVVAQLQSFLNSNRTEITPRGIRVLTDCLKKDEIFIFFRNDHFNTCIKRDGTIYVLVTDIGYITQPDIVWLPLSINDEGDFFNAEFEISNIKSNTKKDENETQPSTPTTDARSQEDTDLLLAKQLQLQEDESISRNLQAKYNKETPQTRPTTRSASKAIAKSTTTTKNPKTQPQKKKLFPVLNTTTHPTPQPKENTQPKQKSSAETGCCVIV